MTGIIRRGGKYVARPNIDGKRVWLGTFDRKADAEKAIFDARSGARVANGDELTVAEAITLYTRQHVNFLQSSTRGNYGRALKSFSDRFGERPTGGVTFVKIQEWALEVPAQYLAAVKAFYGWLKHARLATDDPTLGVRPRPPATRRETRILSAAEVESLIETALEVHAGKPEANYVAAIIGFAAYTAMRPGELAALTWGDVDFGASEIRVRHSRDYTGALKLPKNGRERTIALTEAATDALALIPQGIPARLVFELPEGGLLARATLQRWFDPVRRAAGMPGFRFYNLRHTCATMLLEAGLPSYVVAVQLGHTDNGRLVESTYGHPATSAALERVKAVRLVAGDSRPSLSVVASRSQNGGDAA